MATEDPVEIITHGSFDLKGIGRIYLIHTRELPAGRKIALGDIVIHKGERQRVRAIDLPRTTEDLVGLVLEDE
jgi:hypothetical protein